MKVLMKIHTGYDKKAVHPGDILEVSGLTGKRWIDAGFAEEIKPVEKPVEKVKRSYKKKVK